MIILSLQPITQSDILKIKDILRQSRCPNESLRNTFERFTGFFDGKIFFDGAQEIYNELSMLNDFTALTAKLHTAQLIATII